MFSRMPIFVKTASHKPVALSLNLAKSNEAKLGKQENKMRTPKCHFDSCSQSSDHRISPILQYAKFRSQSFVATAMRRSGTLEGSKKVPYWPRRKNVRMGLLVTLVKTWNFLFRIATLISLFFFFSLPYDFRGFLVEHHSKRQLLRILADAWIIP